MADDCKKNIRLRERFCSVYGHGMEETFADLLRRLRKRERLSLSEVSRQTGLAKGNLCDMEKGNRANPTATTLGALATVYNTSAATLLRAALREKG